MALVSSQVAFEAGRKMVLADWVEGVPDVQSGGLGDNPGEEDG